MKQINRFAVLIFVLVPIISCQSIHETEEPFVESIIEEETQSKTILSSSGGIIELV